MINCQHKHSFSNYFNLAHYFFKSDGIFHSKFYSKNTILA
jgi:hypothetical protein